MESLDAGKLGRLAYLGAVLEETMRLQPAVPTALQRAPERGSGGGVVVCDRCVETRFLSERELMGLVG